MKTYPAGAEPIANPMVAWAKTRGIDVVLWTALESNFADKRKCRFSVPAAISYLKALPPEGKAKAAEYVWRSPEFVQTPLRRVLQQEPWFGARNNDNEVEQRAGRDAVIEHLQHNAVQCGSTFVQQRRIAAFQNREEAEQAITEVVDR